MRSGVPVLLLHWADGAHRLTPLAGDTTGFDLDDAAGFLGQLRQAELSAYAAAPGAVLPRSETFHYIGPNGKHYRSFLRVASALQAPEQLDGAAFWLLSYVGPNTCVVVDSSTITVVGLHLGQYLREEGLAPGMSVALVQPMQGYDSTAADDLLARLTAAVPDPAQRDRALMLVSTVSTGGLARRGRGRLLHLTFTDVRTVALFGPEDADEIPHLDAVLCRLPEDLDRTDRADCEPCRPGPRGASPALQIAPDTYLLGVTQATVSTEIKRDTAAGAVEFLEKYHATGAVFVHRDEPPGRPGARRRHHTVYVDVLRLLNSSLFVEAVETKARELAGRADGLLAPRHPAAVRLAEIVQEQTGLVPVIADPEELARLAREQRARLDVPRLLLVDDAVISGDRLRSYRVQMLDLGILPDELHLLVGLCRTPTVADRVAIAQSLHQVGLQEATFHSVEEFLLPHWGRDECPWCWERERIAEHGVHGDSITDRLIARHDLLERTEEGLRTEVFWGLDNPDFPLGPNSVFGPASLAQADIFAAVASAVQQLRNDGKLDEQFTPPVSKVLDPRFWELERYYATPITAAILRASRPHDLIAPKPGKQFLAATDARFREDASRNLRLELFLALAAGKLPPTEHALNALTEAALDEGLCALFGRLLPQLDAQAFDTLG
jgi:hypothetical protein